MHGAPVSDDLTFSVQGGGAPSAPSTCTLDRSSRPGVAKRGWRGLALLLLAGFILYYPSLRVPFLMDDYHHAAMAEGTFPVSRGPFDLYDFVKDADREVLLERGMLPWWSDPQLTIRFFRPLSSLLRWADHQVFGWRPFPLHLHSFAWWVATVMTARAFFRRWLSPRVAAFATVIFAFAPCHAVPLAWLANREALISLALGVPALGAYLRFREEGQVRDGLRAMVLFGLAMLAGEYSMSLGGYVVAYELLTVGDRLFQRAVRLLPFVVPAAAYLSVRAVLGYGTRGSGIYTDPFQEPAAFLQNAPRRFATLLAQGWLALDTYTLGPATPGWALALLVGAGAALVAVPFQRVFAALEDATYRTAGWMFMGSLLALTPVLAVAPSPRVLGACMLGVAPLVAMLLDRAWFADASERPRGSAELTGWVALALGFAHLVHGPVTSWLMGRLSRTTAENFAVTARELRARIPEKSRAEVQVIRSLGGSFFLLFGLDERGQPPGRWRILAQTGHVLVQRHDERTLDIVAPEGEGMFPVGADNVFRNKRFPMGAGMGFQVQGMRVTVLQAGLYAPRAVRFTFDRDLESAPLGWITEDRNGFHEAEVPPPGFGKPFDP